MAVYILDRNKINGIQYPINSLILTTNYVDIRLRFIGDSVPFLIGKLEDFRYNETSSFADIDSLIAYFNSNYTSTGGGVHEFVAEPEQVSFDLTPYFHLTGREVLFINGAVQSAGWSSNLDTNTIEAPHIGLSGGGKVMVVSF